MFSLYNPKTTPILPQWVTNLNMVTWTLWVLALGQVDGNIAAEQATTRKAQCWLMLSGSDLRAASPFGVYGLGLGSRVQGLGFGA